MNNFIFAIQQNLINSTPFYTKKQDASKRVSPLAPHQCISIGLHVVDEQYSFAFSFFFGLRYKTSKADSDKPCERKCLQHANEYFICFKVIHIVKQSTHSKCHVLF